MCFNANISITTFLIGIVSIIIGLINKTITYSFGIFYFSIVFMQFIEFLIWIYLDNKKINKILSILAYILLNLQVFATIFLLYPYNKILFIILFVILIIRIIILLIIKNYDTIFFRTNKNKITKALDWKFIIYNNNLFYFYFFIYVIFHTAIILLLYNYINNNKYYKLLLFIYIIINIIAITYAYIYYYKYNNASSIYCIFINIFSLAIIIVSICKNYLLVSK